MNIQQLCIIREAVRRGFNLTEVASALSTAQSGVSKHIRDLELELGVELFMRKGKRLVGMTEPGLAILPHVEQALRALGNIRSVASELSGEEDGELRIATTHSQARYIMPAVVARFRAAFPGVRLSLIQTSPAGIRTMLCDDAADIGIATDALRSDTDLVAFPFYRWRHVALVPAGHELGRKPKLKDVARYPLITYHHGFTGRGALDRSFAAARLTPDVVMEAMDADVIKEYVRLGMGIGIVAEMAVDPRETDLRAITPDPSFPEITSFIAIRRDRFLRKFAYRFIETCRPELDERFVRKAAQSDDHKALSTPDAPFFERL